MNRVVFVLSAAALVAGCAFNDCSFETTDVESFDTVRAEATGLGDTLNVVFVDSGLRRLNVFVRADLTPTETTEGEGVIVSYEAEGLEYGEVPSGRAPQFEAVRQGDTVYLYVEGELSPDLFTEVCSPPQAYLRIDVLDVAAPASVRAVRVRSVFVDALAAETAAALRKADAERPRPVLTV